MSERDSVFTDEQVRAIFSAAAERQSRAEESLAPTGGGQTLEELKRIGAEAGLSPEYVEAAARAVALRGAETAVPAKTDAPAVAVSRYVPGELTDRGWEKIVHGLREEFDVTGFATQFGDVREWVSSASRASEAAVDVRLAPEGGTTRLEIRQDFAPARSMGVGMGIGFGATGFVFLGFSLLGGVDMAALGLAISFMVLSLASLIGYQVWEPWYVRRQTARFEALADRIELITRGSADEEP